MANRVDPTRTPAPIIRAHGASTVKGATIEGPTSTIAATETTASTTIRSRSTRGLARPAGCRASRTAATIQTTTIAPQHATFAPSTRRSIAPERSA